MSDSKILFFSSVKNTESFQTQRFYQIDIEILKELGYSVIATNRISDFLQFWKYDITFIYFYRLGLIPSLLSRLFGKQVYFTGGIDDLDLNVSTPKRYQIQKYLFKICRFLATKCFIVSNSDMNNISKLYSKIPSNIVLCYHSIDTKMFIPNQKKDPLLFTTIAWMANKGNVIRKGLDKSLLLFKYLLSKEQFFDAKLIIIGTLGDGSDYLKSYAKELGISSNVIFTGTIEESEKISFLKISQYYMQLSIYEGFGIAALEALTAQNIVIHSGRGGLADSINNHGVYIDIDNLNKENFEKIYLELISKNKYNIEHTSKYVNAKFSNEKRKYIFKNAFSNVHKKD